MAQSGTLFNAFRVIDYAYADPGEPIRPGQTSRTEDTPEQGVESAMLSGGRSHGALRWQSPSYRIGRRLTGNTGPRRIVLTLSADFDILVL